ncbi:hypothetical protein ACI2KR_07495 [Pseudomonas luteola]
MFALIISIIAIALVVALAGATLYYGGDAFSKGSARSTAAALVNQGQQISGAWTLYKADHGGSVPTGTSDAQLSALVSGQYLAAVPTSPTNTSDAPQAWAVTGGSTTGSDGQTTATPYVANVGGASAEVCKEVGNLPGAGGVFSCASNTFSYSL